MCASWQPRIRTWKRRIAEGKFREDLFYRLNTVVINVPPLRERRTDIEGLVTFFLSKSASEFKVDTSRFDKTILKRLENFRWPGNVRQLENVIARAVLQGRGRVITVDDIDAILEDSGSSQLGGEGDEVDATLRGWVRQVLKDTEKSGEGDAHPKLVRELERAMIAEALKLKNGHQGKVAELLGISRVTLRQRVKALGLGESSRI